MNSEQIRVNEYVTYTWIVNSTIHVQLDELVQLS